jgi:hypothetical protein
MKILVMRLFFPYNKFRYFPQDLVHRYIQWTFPPRNRESYLTRKLTDILTL